MSRARPRCPDGFAAALICRPRQPVSFNVLAAGHGRGAAAGGAGPSAKAQSHRAPDARLRHDDRQGL